MSKPTGVKTWVEISAAALLANAQALRRQTAPAKLAAVIKANAYGHGATVVASALRTAADWFAVDSFLEAEALKPLRLKQPILILGYTPVSAVASAVRRGYRLTAYNRETVQAAAKAATASHPARLHLKIETGTTRQGIGIGELSALVRDLRRSRHVIVEGASTHYANVEDTADPGYARQQLSRYEEALAKLATLGIKPSVRHTAGSAAAILYPETRFDLVRTGLALYGLWPSGETKAAMRLRGGRFDLRPVLTWKTTVAQVKTVPAGTPVSYGLTEKTGRSSRLAVLPVGYWDGLDRKLSSVGSVLIRGQRAKIMGRVCMNMCVVDVTDIPGVSVEDEAVILGSQGSERLSAEEIARQCGTINYEIVTRINPLLPRYPAARRK
ncbi:alanine racemase [Candidatus Uhrbacteria bacterium RIFCSPHIGHO2_02_FULL_60_10]|uniref:Alanine racemase n=1 Tax=Candidatus Uhrbacteria bacterium RIFCSPHIGHO2_02_FULL_60_10 TaxID=1802392 RepID=A0A1F7U2L2_9BACT|nr:MAG: alanine racemase [Candidatus Uhrbacteria bacterium RIFCSPHIGHO2_02_FULL_60_10]